MILEENVLGLSLWSYQMVCCVLVVVVVFSLKKNWAWLCFWCPIVKKIGLMLLLGFVIKSNSDCGCGRFHRLIV